MCDSQFLPYRPVDGVGNHPRKARATIYAPCPELEDHSYVGDSPTLGHFGRGIQPHSNANMQSVP